MSLFTSISLRHFVSYSIPKRCDEWRQSAIWSIYVRVRASIFLLTLLSCATADPSLAAVCIIGLDIVCIPLSIGFWHWHEVDHAESDAEKRTIVVLSYRFDGSDDNSIADWGSHASLFNMKVGFIVADLRLPSLSAAATVTDAVADFFYLHSFFMFY